jgi:hypothetical protein
MNIHKHNNKNTIYNFSFFIYLYHFNILFTLLYIINLVVENHKSSNIQDILAALDYMWLLETVMWLLLTIGLTEWLVFTLQ